MQSQRNGRRPGNRPEPVSLGHSRGFSGIRKSRDRHGNRHRAMRKSGRRNAADMMFYNNIHTKSESALKGLSACFSGPPPAFQSWFNGGVRFSRLTSSLDMMIYKLIIPLRPAARETKRP